MNADRSGRIILLNGASSSGKSSIGRALSEPWRLADLLEVLDGYDVTLVDVHCSSPELDRRERARGDRPVALARAQWHVHDQDDNDITVDTTTSDPETCARIVATEFLALTFPKAFDRLRAQRS
ncbi:MAG: hypothetical protein WBV37_16210 [Nocardioidaceae bacterium]